MNITLLLYRLPLTFQENICIIVDKILLFRVRHGNIVSSGVQLGRI